MKEALRIYVGYAIDNASNVEELENDIIAMLKESGRKYVAFFPRRPYIISGLDDNEAIEYVRHVNEAALVSSDVCLFVGTEAFSVGLPIEIDLATKMGKPWVFYEKSDKKPGVYLRVMCKNESKITDSRQKAINWLSSI